MTSKEKPAGEQPNSRAIETDAIDWSYLLRPIDVGHLERLSGASRLPSIKVWEFSRGHFRGMDGYHRWRLAKDRGDKTVSAWVYHFPKDDAGERVFELECVRSNLQHGLPLTQEQRDQAIVRFWNRWGRSSARPAGDTLDELGRVFNLTKQRIHQIVASAEAQAGGMGSGADAGAQVRPSGSPRVLHGGFSTFGRFSSATRRLEKLLMDADFIQQLCMQRGSDVTEALLKLRLIIDRFVTANQ